MGSAAEARAEVASSTARREARRGGCCRFDGMNVNLAVAWWPFQGGSVTSLSSRGRRVFPLIGGSQPFVEPVAFPSHAIGGRACFDGRRVSRAMPQATTASRSTNTAFPAATRRRMFNAPLRHSGARGTSEPGIHNHDREYDSASGASTMCNCTSWNDGVVRYRFLPSIGVIVSFASSMPSMQLTLSATTSVPSGLLPRANTSTPQSMQS